ncbi:hypothetical protein V8B55DRAFT_1480088 [Mucor lusitanicus]
MNSVEQALDSIRSDLDKRDEQKARDWKKKWKKMRRLYVDSYDNSSTRQLPASSLSTSNITIGTIQSSTLNNCLNTSVVTAVSSSLVKNEKLSSEAAEVNAEDITDINQSSDLEVEGSAKATENSESNDWEDNDSVLIEKKSVWQEWLDLYDSISREDLFAFSPILYNVIRLGFGLSPLDRVPYDLYYETLNHYAENAENSYQFKSTITNGNEAYIDKFIDSKTLGEMKSNLVAIKASTSPFLYRLLKIVYNTYDTSLVDIKHSESAFNQLVVAPIVKAAAKELYPSFQTVFFPGEEKLKALLEQLKTIDSKVDKRHGYNADGIIRTRGHQELEVLIYEVSSGYLYQDKAKHSTDHHKGMFGLLSMLKAIADTYKHATLTTFMKQRKVRVPYLFESRINDVLDFVLFANEVKVELEHSLKNLESLREEHETYSRSRRYQNEADYVLLSNIIRPTVVKVSMLKGFKGMADEEPYSSPNIPRF